MNTQSSKKFLTATAMIASWAALIWINCYADLSVAMHLVGIPLIFVVTTGFAAVVLEQRQCDGNH